MDLKELSQLIPAEAGGALREGRVWNVAEPPKFRPVPVLGKVTPVKTSFRVGEFKLEPFDGRDVLFGRWRGDSKWVPLNA